MEHGARKSKDVSMDNRRPCQHSFYACTGGGGAMLMQVVMDLLGFVTVLCGEGIIRDQLNLSHF